MPGRQRQSYDREAHISDQDGTIFARAPLPPLERGG
jgi:hypothetical protein